MVKPDQEMAAQMVCGFFEYEISVGEEMIVDTQDILKSRPRGVQLEKNADILKAVIIACRGQTPSATTVARSIVSYGKRLSAKVTHSMAMRQGIAIKSMMSKLRQCSLLSVFKCLRWC